MSTKENNSAARSVGEQRTRVAGGSAIAEFGDLIPRVADDSLDRSERVIAVGRVVLSISALAIITVDPREPMYSVSMLYSVLTAYIAYSAILLWVFCNINGLLPTPTLREISAQSLT